MDITAGITNILPYMIWMTTLDMAHAVTSPATTTSEVVITNPNVPGLEFHLPPGASITDYDGNPVTQLTITQIPIGRPPFPLPKGVVVPFYFTIQPGGSYINVAGGSGARLYYPNRGRAPTGYKFNFWNYDPDSKGWYIYGTGAVDANRRFIAPDPGVVIYQLTGAMVGSPGSGGPGGGPPRCPGPRALPALPECN